MNKTYTVKLEGKRWTECLDKTFVKKRKDIKLDGFRKGQVPKDVYIKHFGIESLYMDSLDMAVDILYGELLSDPKTVTPAATPGIDIKNINDKEVEVTFTLVPVPEVKLGKYKNLGIKKETAEVTDEEIEHELEHIKNQYADVKVLDDKEKIDEGHIAVINFEGFLNGKAFDGGKGEDYSLTIGSHTFIPGFEEQLIGLKKGDKKDVNVTFPENYHSEELKGKPVIFKVEVKEVKERVMPKFDKEFFKDMNVGGVETLEDLKNYISENKKAEKERQIEDEYLFKCLDKVVSASKFEIPKEMTDDELNRLVKEFSERLEMQGMKLDDYLKFTSSDMDKFKETLIPEANKRIGYRLMVDEIVKADKIEVTEEEIKAELDIVTKQYGITEEDVYKQMGSKEVFKYELLMRKVMKIVTGNEK